LVADTKDRRLEEITDAVFALAARDFSRELPIADDGSSLDGLAAAVNMLKEEIVARLEAERENEEALRRKEDQLRHAQKMEAIGRLAGGVAHDFNNLLTVILSYAEMAIDSLSDEDPVREELTEIQRAGARAAELTRQLLLFSRQQVVEPRSVYLGEVLAGMENMLRRLLGEDIVIRCRSTSRSAIRADPGLIEQVLMNLVLNARDAMPSGGTIHIEATDVDIDDRFVDTHLAAMPGRHVMLAVSDTGMGMDKATQLRIFEPFFTTKDRGKGTGLGLSTVFGIVKQSGGSIHVESAPGRGTTFKLYFPYCPAQTEPALSRAATVDLRGTETILLVEDEDQVRQVASSILRRQDYTVLEARGGGEALVMFEQHVDRIDLVLTDVIMPHLSGPQLVQRLLAIRPSLRVLYMSGYTDDAVLHPATSDPTHFVQKPITPALLARKVRERLDARDTDPHGESEKGVGLRREV
jgi:two-component system, cell cycle sensor histidine kinase and response regulator CckA